MKKESQLATLIAVATLTLAGCASSPDSASSLATDAEQTQTITQIDAVRKAITKAEGQLKQADEEELSWFAGNDMDAANKALAEAKKYYAEFEMDPTQANESTGFFSSQTNIGATEEAIVQFNTHLTSAKDIKATALEVLADAFDYRTQLTLIDAQEYFPSTVEELNKTLKKLVDQVADGKTDSALAAQPALVAQQRTLEIKTVTAIYLTDAKQTFDKLLKTDAPQHAPNALSQVSASLTSATAFIAAQPRAIEQIKMNTEEVMFSIRRAENIAVAVKTLKALPQKDYESYLVNYENILLSITQALDAEDNRDLDFEQQGKRLVTFIESTLSEQQAAIQAQQTLTTELKRQTAYNALLEQKIIALTATESPEASNASELEESDSTEKPGMTDTPELTDDVVETTPDETSESSL